MTKYNISIGQVYNSWTVINETEIRKKGLLNLKLGVFVVMKNI